MLYVGRNEERSGNSRLAASAATWVERRERRPQHDCVALVVDATAPGPPGELCELRRGRNSWPSPLYLLSRSITTVRAGMLMPERQRLGREDRLHQALDEAVLDRLAKAGIMPAWCAAMPCSSASSHRS